MGRWIVGVVALLASAGCDKASSPQSADTGAMALLRSGAPKVCAAEEVKETLRDLIVPKASGLGDFALPVEDKNAAIQGVAVKLSYATLQAFDKSVAKATCNATVTLEQNGSEVGTGESLDYTISPSAEDDTSFVVSAGISDLRLAARAAVVSTLNAQLAQRETEAVEARTASEHAALSRTVSRTWLVGRWVASTAESGNCVDGPYEEYRRDGTFLGYESAGRWTLTGTELSVTGESEGEPFSTTTTITAADANGFSEQRDQDAPTAMRRCSRADAASADETIG